jgi:septal ring factor EnvC (AmiA/AmiB activator)
MSCLDARTLGVMTGAGFPVIFGHDARTPYPFVRRLLDERATSCAQVAEAESRASSSRQDSLALEAALGEATRTASALGAEVHQHQLELADLGEENRRLRAAVTQMRAEILTLHRRLDLLPPQGHDPQAGPPATAPSKHDWEVMRGDLQRLNAHAIDLASRLNATHGSRSWRVTRPIRAVAHALRRLRPGASGEPEA